MLPFQQSGSKRKLITVENDMPEMNAIPTIDVS